MAWLKNTKTLANEFILNWKVYLLRQPTSPPPEKRVQSSKPACKSAPRHTASDHLKCFRCHESGHLIYLFLSVFHQSMGSMRRGGHTVCLLFPHCSITFFCFFWPFAQFIGIQLLWVTNFARYKPQVFLPRTQERCGHCWWHPQVQAAALVKQTWSAWSRKFWKTPSVSLRHFYR